LLIDITILSKVCVTESVLDSLNQEISSIDALMSQLETIASYVEDIDSRLPGINSTVDNLNTFVTTTINSQLDQLERNNASIESLVQVIDTRTETIYDLQQTTASKVDIDVTLEEAILSKLMIIDSKSDNLNPSCSSIGQIIRLEESILSVVQVIDTRTESIYSIEQTTLSYVEDINNRTVNVESAIGHLDTFVQTSINSKLNRIENSHLSIESILNAIDSITDNIYSLDQLIASQVDINLAIDQTTESIVADITSKLNNISCSQLEQIVETDYTILSKMHVIDTRTESIQSDLETVYSLDQHIVSQTDTLFAIDTSISSKLDVNIAIDTNIASLVDLIDSKIQDVNPSCSLVSELITVDESILSTLNVIDSRTSNIQSTLNNIYSLEQVISSKIDTDTSLASSIEVLGNTINTIESYSDNIVTVDTAIASAVSTLSLCCTNTTSTNPILASIFGTQVMENTLDYISIQFQYGIPTYTTTPYTQGGGTVTSANSMAVLSTAASANSIAQLQTNDTIIYRSGHEVYALFTVAFTGSFAATSSQFIGPIDYQNGFAVGFDGTTFGVTQRSNTVNTFIPQSSFNGDKLNGTGASGFSYNPALLNVFRIAYGYLGGTVIQFQIMNTTGGWITFHTIDYPNSSANPSIQQPFLPITARVENLAGTSALTLETASWNGGIIGQPSNNSYRYFAANNILTIGASPIVALVIRNKTVFGNKPNRVQVRCASIGTSAADASNTLMMTSAVKNATISGASFSDVSAGNSVVEFSTTGTYASGTGTQVFYTVEYRGAMQGLMDIPSNVYNIILNPGESLTILVNSTASISVFTGICWEEQF